MIYAVWHGTGELWALYRSKRKAEEHERQAELAGYQVYITPEEIETEVPKITPLNFDDIPEWLKKGMVDVITAQSKAMYGLLTHDGPFYWGKPPAERAPIKPIGRE